MSSSRELQLEATATIEDATSKLQDLLSSIKDLPEEITTKVDIDSETAESQVESIKNDIEDVPDEVTTTIDVNGDAESQIADIKSEIETIEDTVSVTIDANDNASDIADNIKSTIEELDGQISTVTINADGDALEVADEVKTDLEELDGSEVTVTINAEGASETEDDIDGASDAASDYGGILDAIFGAGATAAFTDTITASGNFESSWTRLRNAVGEGGTDINTVMSEWSSTISQMTSSTGRGAGDARDMITEVGQAGVRNKGVMVDLFEGISEASYQTGTSMDILDSSIAKLVRYSEPRMKTINNQLKISDQTIIDTYGSVDAFKEKWKNASADQRAEMISTLLHQQYLSDGVADYGDSWEHSVDKAGRSITWLGIQLGSPLLDAAKSGLNGFADIVNDIANAFGDLPGPIKTAISAFFGLTAVGTLIKGIGESFDKLGIKIISNPMTKIGDYMLKPLKIVFDNISKLIPDSVKDWKTKIKTFVDDIKTIFEEKPKFEIISEEDGVIEEAKLNSFKSKVSSFVNDIKTKIEEIKGKFKLSDIFSSEEEGTSTLDKFKAKFSTFVEDIKVKWSELKGKIKLSDIFTEGEGETTNLTSFKLKIESFIESIKVKWESLKGKLSIKSWFGDGEGSVDLGSVKTRIYTLVDDIKIKWGELKGSINISEWFKDFNVSDITGKISSSLKAFNWKGLGLDIAGSLVEGIAMGIGIYFGEQDLTRKQEEYEKYKNGEPYNLSADELKEMQKSENIDKWKKENPPTYTGESYGFDDLYNDAKKFYDWITTVKWPNVLDLILPGTASAA
ncbi:MAG: hypothetical protein ACP5OJ_07015, partial [Methanothermobacter sp.]